MWHWLPLTLLHTAVVTRGTPQAGKAGERTTTFTCAVLTVQCCIICSFSCDVLCGYLSYLWIWRAFEAVHTAVQVIKAIRVHEQMISHRHIVTCADEDAGGAAAAAAAATTAFS